MSSQMGQSRQQNQKKGQEGSPTVTTINRTQIIENPDSGQKVRSTLFLHFGQSYQTLDPLLYLQKRFMCGSFNRRRQQEVTFASFYLTDNIKMDLLHTKSPYNIIS